MSYSGHISIKKVLAHSRLIRWARISLPMGTCLLLLLLFWLPKFMGESKLSAQMLVQNNQTILESEVPVLSEPRYKGEANGWRYDISAHMANNVYEETARVDLTALKGTFFTEAGESFKTRANAGSWFTAEQVLELTGNASLFYSLGYFIESEQVQVSIQDQQVRTLGAASGEAEFGKFKAQKIRIEDNGNMIWLLGESHVTIIGEKSPKNISASPQEPAPIIKE